MAAPVVYDDVAEDTNLHGDLFAGKKFWVAMRIPSRTRYLDLIRNNGGEVVVLEKKADYMIADHFRRDCPPGSISYSFIDGSIKAGELQDPEQHRAGPAVGTTREAGSMSRPAKRARAAYTAEDDRILYKWVRDAQAQGASVNGNELYKQLEAQHPQHPWQSWRDRWLKQLRDLPSAAFKTPHNAPPSPPEDGPTEPAPAPIAAKKPTTKEAKAPGPAKVSGQGKTRSKDDYSVDDFDSLFSKEDWEELYAFVDVISDCSAEKYADAWKSWAEGKSQSAEQWKQYFEKVVRPQWERDDVEKRNRIRAMVEKRHEEEAEPSQQASQTFAEAEPDSQHNDPGPTTPNLKLPVAKSKEDNLEGEGFEHYLDNRQKGKLASAYVFYARAKKCAVWNANPGLDYSGLHRLLISQWNSLSAEDRAPYLAQEAAEQGRTSGDPAPQACPSSSTAVQETPHFIREKFDETKQRIETTKRAREGHNENEENDDGATETRRAVKRQKSLGASPRMEDVQEKVPVSGSQQQPLEISSGESAVSQSPGRDENIEDPIQDGMQVQETIEEEAVHTVDLSADSSDSEYFANDELAPLPPPAATAFDPMDSSDFPSNTPTPRAPRHKASAFDTQAILSSPSQDSSLQALPLPASLTQLAEAAEMTRRSPPLEPSPPAQEPESEASTTQSLEEFRRSLNDEDISPPDIAPLQQPVPSSPATSFASSTGSGDPDPPLEDDEFDEFFQEQYEEGFTDEHITAALKRTRLRPALAMRVLAAWKDGGPLPNERGIWSEEDDEDVEGGDGMALARLQRKHTMDRWGGITERLRFLEQYRSRGERR